MKQKNTMLESVLHLIENRKLWFEAGANKILNLIISSWFLRTELIAWKSQYLQAWKSSRMIYKNLAIHMQVVGEPKDIQLVLQTVSRTEPPWISLLFPE